MEFEKNINRVLTDFFKVTQIEALYFDKQMNITSCEFQQYTYEDFCRLGIGEIEIFLKELFTEDGRDAGGSYVYYLRNNYICNISVLNINGSPAGAFVTQPIVLNTLKRDALKHKCDILPMEERDAYIRAMLRAPVVSLDRIRPIGTTLDLLIKHNFSSADFRPVISGGEMDPLLYQLTQTENAFDRQHSHSYLQKFDNYSTYLKIKDAITRGDSEALLEVFDHVDMEGIAMDQHASKDIIRSIKNRLIESCAMCGFFALEAQAPYVKTRNYVKHIIREIENTDNVNDMYTLVRTAIKTLTRYVAMSRITGYSKHIRLATEYIEKHFAEEITLESLAEVTGISKYYLSSLIKKETGLSFTDIINRVRVEESKKLLEESKISLAEVSSSVGFGNPNYFTKVFKQHTGMTPTEFSKTVAKSTDEDIKSKDILRALLTQLAHVMELFSGVFDSGRIVDPILNKAWMTHPSGKIMESKCWDFLAGEQLCDKCISNIALNGGKSFLKLDEGVNGPFLLSATPITVGGNRYIIELFKKIEDNFFDYLPKPNPYV